MTVAAARHVVCSLKRLALLVVLSALVCVVVIVDAHAAGKTTTFELAVVPEDSSSAAAEKSEGPIVRCRMCGARIANKHDHLHLHDTSKAVSSRHSTELGADVHTFVNPSRVEMEVVAFKKAVGIESESFTTKASFFEGYNWRDLRCGGCSRHVGWKFHHDDYEQCIQTEIMESVSASVEEELKLATTTEREKRKELVRKELEGTCVTANAGWWSYQVCYKKEVRQYHEEADGTRPSDWSMGEYVSDDKKPGDKNPIMGTDIVQYYAGGQHCDENGELRSSKVVYACCKSKPKTPTIDNVEEPSLCSYVITVCVPSLCSKSAKSDLPYNYDEVSKKCEADFDENHKDTNLPASFAALRWSTVISDDSSELDWTRNMQLKA